MTEFKHEPEVEPMSFHVELDESKVSPQMSELVQATRAYWAGKNTEKGFVFSESVTAIIERLGLKPLQVDLTAIAKKASTLTYTFKCQCRCGCTKEMKQFINATRSEYLRVCKNPPTVCVDCLIAAEQASRKRKVEAEQERKSNPTPCRHHEAVVKLLRSRISDILGRYSKGTERQLKILCNVERFGIAAEFVEARNEMLAAEEIKVIGITDDGMARYELGKLVL